MTVSKSTVLLVSAVIVLAGCTQQPVTAPVPGSTGASPSVARSADPTGAAPASPSPASPRSGSPSSSAPTATRSSATPTEQPSAPASKVPKSEQTVVPKAVRSKKPVTPGTKSTLRRGLEVEVSSLEAITTEPSGPGESAGPGVAVGLTVRNRGAKQVDLDRVGVTMEPVDGGLADTAEGSPAKPLGGRLASGSGARGTYVFRVEKPLDGASVTITVVWDGSNQATVITGRVS